MSPSGIQRRHRLMGIALLLPFLTWSLTGLFFLVRPGYTEAYERIPVRQYQLPANIPVTMQPDWQEIRYLRSVLGNHLLVQTDSGWQHRHGENGEIWPLPEASDLTRMLEDAFQFNPDRYGRVARVEGNRAWTDTGIEVDVSWSTLNISQYGNDSRWIDRIYSWHYLEWTGFYWTDRILGIGGLILLIYMTYTGAIMAFGRRRIASSSKP